MEDSNTLSMARQWLLAGKPERALSTAQRGLADATSAGCGIEQAWFDLAWVHVWTDDLASALTAFEHSHPCRPSVDDPLAVFYLKALRDHGLVLAEHGKTKQARALLQLAWDETGYLAGDGGPEQAMLAEPLAQVMLADGESGPACDLLESAAGILVETEGDRLPGALALLVEARAADGREPFGSMPDLTETGADHLFQHLALRVEESDPIALHQVYLAGVDWLEEHHPLSSTLAAALGALAKLAEEVGDIGGQIAAIDRAIEIYRERRETGYAIQALQGRALALAEAGEYQESEADYRAAHDQATMAGSLPLMSQVGRNLARFLADRDHQVEAESYFKQALEQARQAAHPELAGKALVAWGIFHTHQGRKNQAHACFDEAIPLLPQDDPHVRAANDHIESINSGTACACVDPIQIAARSLRRDVRRALPPRCARSVEVLVVGDGFEVRLDLARTLTDPEQAALQKVMDRKRK